MSRLTLAGPRDIFGIDLRTLALFRIGLGLSLLIDLALRVRDLSAHYTDAGILPRAMAVTFLSPGSFSLHLLNGTAWFQAGLFLLAAVFAVMLLAGFRTRLAIIASWLLLLSLQNRNPQILSGDDNLMMLLTFWAMFLPLGARFSIDAALDRRSPPPNACCSLAAVALLIQGMSMYFFSALLTADAQWVPDGSTAPYALQPDYLAAPVALWLRQVPDVLHGLSYYVWTLALVGPLLIFLPVFHRTLRSAMIVAFMTLHMGFYLCFDVGPFPMAAILMNLVFLPGWVWDRLGTKMRPAARQNLAIYYDPECSFSHKICRLLTTFLILPGVPIRPASSDSEAAVLLAVDYSGAVSDGEDSDYPDWDAVRHLVSCSPLFWPVAKVMGLGPLRPLGTLFYQSVARHRPALGRFADMAFPWRSASLKTGKSANALAGFFLAFVIFQNFTTLPGFPFRMPDPMASFRQTMGLYQNWAAFTPHAGMTLAWPVILGELEDGTVVDVYARKPGLPDWNKPERLSRVYGTDRWHRYFSLMEELSREEGANRAARNYARYLCRSWNRAAPPERTLSVFNIYFNLDYSPPDHRPITVRNRLVWSHDCFA